MKSFKQSKRQKGDMLLNIGIAIFIMLILSVWGIPKIKSYLIEGKIPSVGDEIMRFASRVKVSTAGSGTTPYAGLTQAYFARAVRGSALQVGAVSGQGTGGTDVRHDLGGGDTGLVTLTTTGATFSLTFANVSDAACPGLATSLQSSFDNITVNGKAAKTTNATTNVVTTGYVGGTVAANCTDGDTNTFVFTMNRS